MSMKRVSGVGCRASVGLLFGAALALAGCSKDNAAGGTRDSVRSAESVSGATTAPDARRPTSDGSRRLVIAGTSLTAGLGLEADSAYPKRLDRLVEQAGLPYDVVNAGVSGETSAGLVRRLEWLLRAPVDVFVLETGANDGLRALPVAQLRSNLRTALARVRAAHPNAALYLVQMEAPPNLGRAYTEAFHAAYADAARETGATLLPFLLDGVAGVADMNQPDGIHPNDAGARLIAERLFKQLERNLRERSAEGRIDPRAPAR